MNCNRRNYQWIVPKIPTVHGTKIDGFRGNGVEYPQPYSFLCGIELSINCLLNLVFQIWSSKVPKRFVPFFEGGGLPRIVECFGTIPYRVGLAKFEMQLTDAWTSRIRLMDCAKALRRQSSR